MARDLTEDATFPGIECPQHHLALILAHDAPAEALRALATLPCLQQQVEDSENQFPLRRRRIAPRRGDDPEGARDREAQSANNQRDARRHLVTQLRAYWRDGGNIGQQRLQVGFVVELLERMDALLEALSDR